MKHTPLWICLYLLATLVLVAARVEATAAESATPAPTALATPEPAPTPNLPAHVLFVGDNGSSFLDKYLPILAASSTVSTTVEGKTIVRVDAPLSMHWQVGKAAGEIGTGKWDLVVLQEDVARSWDRLDEFHQAVRQFHEEIEKAGAETMLYMTWPHKGHTPPTIEQIADVYSQTAAELGANVAPVGLAFERATRERPALNLYLADGVKDNLRGFYLTMCVLYATIFERSPVGLAYRLEDIPDISYEYGWWGLDVEKDWQISEEEAAFLQRIAWETVTDYRAAR